MQETAAMDAPTETPATSERVHTAVLIGRFQPLHNGHMALLRAALERAEQIVVVLGSAWQAPNPKNPFSWQERAQMLRSEEHTSELQSPCNLVCRLLLEK